MPQTTYDSDNELARSLSLAHSLMGCRDNSLESKKPKLVPAANAD